MRSYFSLKTGTCADPKTYVSFVPSCKKVRRKLSTSKQKAVFFMIFSARLAILRFLFFGKKRKLQKQEKVYDTKRFKV